LHYYNAAARENLLVCVVLELQNVHRRCAIPTIAASLALSVPSSNINTMSICLIDLFVETYRLSIHARLEAFVIQTKLNKQQ
jgi:hypothetical protein